MKCLQSFPRWYLISLNLALVCLIFTNRTICANIRQIEYAEGDNQFIITELRNGRFYFLLKDSFLDRDLLLAVRIVNQPFPVVGVISQRARGNKTKKEEVFRFSRSGHRILMNTVISDKIKVSAEPPTFSFEIEECLNTEGYTEFDVTDLFFKDCDRLLFNKRAPSWILTLGEGRTAVNSVRTRKDAVDIALSRYYPADSLQFNVSIILLSDKPMRVRKSDSRINYLTCDVFDSSRDNIYQAVTRWRLEPKESDIGRYNKGDIVEPKKPIIFYLDTLIPPQWVPWFIDGVNSWSRSFEKAGFRNAIFARKVPSKAEDSAFNFFDSKNSTIDYVTSDILDATYSTILDTRSGEILQSRIIWSTGVLKLVRDWYLIQAYPSDVSIRNFNLPDSVMGQMISFLVSHEIGHALGFDHNMIASNSVSIGKLRNQKWLKKNGFCPSVMDYARCNYVAQPRDDVNGRRALINGVGEYDDWAIHWGYYFFPSAMTSFQEQALLKSWIDAKRGKKQFRSLRSSDDDPRAEVESLGDNAVKASFYGIKNLKYITQYASDIDDSLRLGEIYQAIYRQFGYYIKSVSVNIGGNYTSFNDRDSEMISVPARRQKQAIAFLNSELFTTPKWIFLDEASISPNEITTLTNLQRIILRTLFSEQCIYNLSTVRVGRTPLSTYFFNQIRKTIWSQLYTNSVSDVFNTRLRVSYIKALMDIVKPEPTRIVRPFSLNVDQLATVRIIVNRELIQLKDDLASFILECRDTTTKNQLESLYHTLESINK